MENEFDHYGVKGMRWGRRKQRASGYTDKQYAQDTAMYSKRGARRINKRIQGGDKWMKNSTTMV